MSYETYMTWRSLLHFTELSLDFDQRSNAIVIATKRARLLSGCLLDSTIDEVRAE